MRRWCAALVLSTLFAAPSFAGDISPQANRELLLPTAKKPGVIVLPSGLQYRVIKSGSGATPARTIRHRHIQRDAWWTVLSSIRPRQAKLAICR
jgi:hypothetical protein